MRQGHQYSFIHTLDQVLELCGSVHQPNVGILLDSWHWYVSGATLDDIQSLSSSQIVGVHVNDAPAGISLEEQKDNQRCLPGETGVIDLVGFLKVLKAIGYDGPVTVEPFSQRLRELAPQEAAMETSEALRRVWGQAGVAES
jgi:sugar phosphate isomerase/epimerase